MATITGEIKFRTRWLLNLDVQDIITTVKNAVAVAKGVGTVFFIGETHKIGFDLDRRHAVYQAFAGNDRVTILLERGMEETRQSNVVQENNFFSSNDDARNVQVMAYLTEELNSSGYLRPILIFFGQEHEDRIKQLIAQRFPADMRLRWVSVPTISDSVANEPNTAFDPTGLFPAGYVDCVQARLDYKFGLLKKGIVHEPFNLELARQDCVMEALVWAVYFTTPRTNALKRREVQTGGTTTAKLVRIALVRQAFVVLLLRRDIPFAELGTLTNAHLRSDYF
jgi:hypothetical protein